MTIIQAMNKKKKKKGFTLVELVIVVAILALLAVIAIPRFSDMTLNAKLSSFESNHKIIMTGVAQYTIDHPGSMPTSTTLTEISEYISDVNTGDPVTTYFNNKPAGAVYVWTPSAGATPGYLTSTLTLDAGANVKDADRIGTWTDPNYVIVGRP